MNDPVRAPDPFCYLGPGVGAFARCRLELRHSEFLIFAARAAFLGRAIRTGA